MVGYDLLVSNPAVVLENVSRIYRVAASGSGKRNQTNDWLRKIAAGAKNSQRMDDVHALKPMSLVVEHGECVGVIGRNGSGKSTLMRLISGQESPTTGTVRATSVPIALGVSAALMPDCSGAANIELGCLAMGMTRDQVTKKFDQIVELSALGASVHRPMRTYSSGMAARLRFAIASAIDPEILLLDEALNTGDAEFGERTRKRMTELRENAGCVFLVSHSMKSIKELSTRVIWIDEGELLLDGNTGQVVQLYERFIGQLRRRDFAGANKTKRAARREMTAVEVLVQVQGRRRVR